MFSLKYVFVSQAKVRGKNPFLSPQNNFILFSSVWSLLLLQEGNIDTAAPGEHLTSAIIGTTNCTTFAGQSSLSPPL